MAIVGKQGAHGTLNGDGYRTFWVDGQNKYEHRLVWERLHGSIPKGMIVHHKDEDRTNNDPSNLELMDIRTHNRLHSDGYKLVDGAWQKRCLDCRSFLSLSEFYSRRFQNKKNGKSYETLNSRCKPCARAFARVK